MKYEIFSSTIVGYKNKSKNNKSQDFVDYKKIDKGVICAIADGHSTRFFEYSDQGAKFACKVSVDILEQYIYKSKEEVEGLLQEGIIQKEIHIKWMDMVNNHYKNNNPKVFKTEYIKYSTTLISTIITENLTLFLKIGDGKIILKKNDVYESILETDNKSIVDSLGRFDSFNNIHYKIDKSNIYNNDNIILCTDGYNNSFSTDMELFASLEKTINKYDKSIFSRYLLYREYKKYLYHLSKNYSLDDISIVFIF